MKSPKGRHRPAAQDSPRRKLQYRPLLEVLEDRNAPGDGLAGLSLLGPGETTEQPLSDPASSSGVTGLSTSETTVGYSAGDPTSTTTGSIIVTSPTLTTSPTTTTTISTTPSDGGLGTTIGVTSRDVTPPDVDLDLPDFSTNPRLTLGVSASDNGRLAGTVAIDVDLNGDGVFKGRELNYRAGRLMGGQASLGLPQLPEGTFDVRARVRDLAGNVGMATVTTQIDPNAGKIGDERLLRLMSEYQAAAAASPTGQPDAAFSQQQAADPYLVFDGQGRLAINARAVHSQWFGELRQNLEALGMQVVHTRPAHAQVLGWLSLDKVASLTSLPHFASATAVLRPIVESGAVPGQPEEPRPDGANDAQGTLAFRNATGATGVGQFVGVISDSADFVDGNPADPEIGIAESQLSGDLPEVGVFNIFDVPGSDEGRAMLEIVHDIAPGANLSFASGVFGIDFALDLLTTPVGFTYPGATVVTDDLSFFISPIYNDGIFSQTIDDAVLNRNIVYTGSAGNAGSWGAEFTNLASTRWVSNIRDPLRVPIPAGIYLDMDPGPAVDLYSNITLTSVDGLGLKLHWDSAFLEGGSFLPGFQVNTDLDVLLISLNPGNFGEVVASSQIRNKITDEAFEIMDFTGEDDEPFYGIAVRKIGAGPNPTRVRFTRRGGDETHTAVMQYQTRLTNPSAPVLGFPTTFGNHTATQMLSVAAMPWFAINANEYEGFTSPGPSTILFNQLGQRLTTPQVRLKPDVIGMDGVNTTFFPDLLADITDDSDIFPNFFGTSASAPAVAALAALVRSQAPTATGAQITQHIRNTARDVTGGADLSQGFDPQNAVAPAGWDARTGFGLAQAVAFSATPPPPPPVPGGGTVGIAGGPDRFEPNNSSSQASFIDLTAVTLPYSVTVPNLTIHQNSIPDRDFFRIIAPFTSPLIVTMDAAPTAGDLDLFVYKLTSTGSLVLLGSSQTRSVGTDELVGVNVTAGNRIIIQISGFTTSTVRNIGDYQLTISQ